MPADRQADRSTGQLAGRRQCKQEWEAQATQPGNQYNKIIRNSYSKDNSSNSGSNNNSSNSTSNSNNNNNNSSNSNDNNNCSNSDGKK